MTPKKTPKKKIIRKTIKKKMVIKKKVAKKQTKKRVSRTIKPKDIIVVSPVAPDLRIVVASELADDAMIEKELMGEIMPFFIYSFPLEGKKITGLTVKGVNEVVRRLNRNKKSGVNIRLNPNYKTIERDVEYDGQKGVEVSVFAENLVDGNSAWGVKFEPYKKARREGGTYTNTFAVEKALSKAERNAKRKLIPETAVIKMIQTLIGENPDNVQQLKAPAATARIVAPPKAKPSSPEEIKDLIRTAINTAKNIDFIIKFDRKTQADKRFDPEFKKEIRALASKRADELHQLI